MQSQYKDIKDMSEEEIEKFRNDLKEVGSAIKGIFCKIGKAFCEVAKMMSVHDIEDVLSSSRLKRMSRRRRRAILRAKYPDVYKTRGKHA